MSNQKLINKFIHFIQNTILNAPKNKSDKKFVFILGCPRSGTTLLEAILCSHPKLGGMGYETTGLLLCGDWRHYRNSQIDQNDMKLLLEGAKDIIQFYNNFTDYILKKKGKEIFVDKPISQSPFALRFYKKYFPNAFFINIIRNGLDCYCSARKHPHVPQARSIHGFAKLWKNRIVQRMRPDRHKNVLDVKYEELVKDPELIVRKIMDFLSEEYFLQQIDYHYFSETTGLSKVKHHKNLGKPISGYHIGTYKKELNQDEISTFLKIAGEELKNLGY